MSEPRDPALTPEEERVRDAVRALGAPAANLAFRNRLRNDFVSGRVGGKPVPTGAPGPGWWTRWVALPAAAAILVVALVLVNRGPALTLVRAAGEGTAWVNAVEIPVADHDALTAALRPGATLKLNPTTTVDVRFDHVLMFQASPGTEWTIPNSPGRWMGSTARCLVRVGELQVMTGPEFSGRGLVVHTPDGMIELTGTIVSVVTDSTGTCVCVQEGTARIGPNPGALEAVPAGKRMVLPRGQAPFIAPIAPPHQAHLKAFESQYRSLVGRPAEPGGK
jgi:ferric-dicitrate binding protein FerR (iron transport regulator)